MASRLNQHLRRTNCNTMTLITRLLRSILLLVLSSGANKLAGAINIPRGDGTVTLGTVQGGNIIPTAYILLPDIALTNGPYIFLLQADCDLGLYKLQQSAMLPMWRSGTSYKGFPMTPQDVMARDCYVKLNADGSLAVYNGYTTLLWSSESKAVPSMGPFHFRLGRNGDAALVYDLNGMSFWSIPVAKNRIPA